MILKINLAQKITGELLVLNNLLMMIDSFKSLFAPDNTDYAQLIKDGAVILDVRSREEYASGHIQGSVNISVDTLKGNLHLLKNKDKPIITYCAAGIRSATAMRLLKANGYTAVYDGGSLSSLSSKI
ncbi:MAG: rhodanese-like domain-containing protein [Candidatus Omnitrophota bacterium]